MSQDPPPRSEMAWDVALGVSDGIVTAKVMHRSVGQAEAPAIHRRVHEGLAEAGDDLRAIVLELSEVTFMNSMGVGMCIDLRNKAAAKGAVAFMVGLTPELRKLLETVRVDELFTLVDDVGAVSKALG